MTKSMICQTSKHHQDVIHKGKCQELYAIVVPPASAALVPEQKSSTATVPIKGSSMWVWQFIIIAICEQKRNKMKNMFFLFIIEKPTIELIMNGFCSMKFFYQKLKRSWTKSNKKKKNSNIYFLKKIYEFGKERLLGPQFFTLVRLN